MHGPAETSWQFKGQTSGLSAQIGFDLVKTGAQQDQLTSLAEPYN